MRTLLTALLATALVALSVAHPSLSEQTPDAEVVSWLTNLSGFFSDLLSNMSPPYVSTAGGEEFIPAGVGTSYNITWVGEHERLSVIVTYVDDIPYRMIAVLRVRSDAPWHPYPAMLDVFNDVVNYYEEILGNYSPDLSSGIESFNRYWSARYPSLEGHKIYVGLGKPAQVLVRLKDEYGVIKLVIADQLGPPRRTKEPRTLGGFNVSESLLREKFCGSACMIEGIWVYVRDHLKPVYVIRSYLDGEGEVVAVDASTGSPMYEDRWANEELVTSSPKPPDLRVIAANIAEVAVIASIILAVVAVLLWRHRHPGEGIPGWAGLLVIAAILAGLLVLAIVMVGMGGFWSSLCILPPGGLCVRGVEDFGSTGKVVHLGFSSGHDGFVALKFVAWRGAWVSECVKCVFMVPPGSVGNATIVFDGIPSVVEGGLRVGVYGYPEYLHQPYVYLEWGRCGA